MYVVLLFALLVFCEYISTTFPTWKSALSTEICRFPGNSGIGLAPLSYYIVVEGGHVYRQKKRNRQNSGVEMSYIAIPSHGVTVPLCHHRACVLFQSALAASEARLELDLFDTWPTEHAEQPF